MAKHSVVAGVLVTVAGIVAAPFVLGAALLAINAAKLPASAGQVPFARSLGAATFVFGFAVGLVAAVYALAARSLARRILGTAGVLLGCSHVALGIILRKTIEHEAIGTAQSLIPIALPVAIWAASAWLALKTLRDERERACDVETAHEHDEATDSTSVEQRRLLSPP